MFGERYKPRIHKLIRHRLVFGTFSDFTQANVDEPSLAGVRHDTEVHPCVMKRLHALSHLVGGVHMMLHGSHRLCRYIDSRRFHRHARFLALSAYEVSRLRMLSGWSNDNGLARRRSLDLDLKNTMLHKTGIYYASRTYV